MRKTHCKRGHELNDKNTYVAPKTGIRSCRSCRRNGNPNLFGGNREAAIQRDGERCVRCGMTRDEHIVNFGRDITVDHIDGNGSSKPVHLKNNELSNLQTLCISCHARKDNTQNRLTDEQVINIRHVGREAKRGKLAVLYNVSPGYIDKLMASLWRKDLPNPSLNRKRVKL